MQTYIYQLNNNRNTFRCQMFAKRRKNMSFYSTCRGGCPNMNGCCNGSFNFTCPRCRNYFCNNNNSTCPGNARTALIESIRPIVAVNPTIITDLNTLR